MAITLVGIGATSFDGINPLPVAYPAGIAADDIAIFLGAVSSNDTTAGTAAATGFTKVDYTSSGSSWDGVWEWRRCDGTETGNLDFDMSSGDVQRVGTLLVFRGCIATGNPYEANSAVSGSSTASACSNVITTGADRVVINAHIYNTNSNPADPGGWTLGHNDLNGGNTRRSRSIYKAQATAATVTGTSLTIASAGWVAIALALIPVPAGGARVSRFQGKMGFPLRGKL